MHVVYCLQQLVYIFGKHTIGVFYNLPHCTFLYYKANLIWHHVTPKKFGVLVASNVFISVWRLFSEMRTLLATMTSNGFDFDDS